MLTEQTITAVASGRGGAITIIRLSGSDAIAVTDIFFTTVKGEKISSKNGFTIHYGNFCDSKGEKIDDVMVSVFTSPRSYTGEHMIEISCHASEYIISTIITELIGVGVRIAEPGEFTRRAYLNGKMDIIQAEAVGDIIASSSKSSHMLAMNQMKGGYTREFNSLRTQLLHFISLLELELDFSEEDVEFVSREELRKLLQNIYDNIERLVSSFRLGNAIKNGVPVSIVGAPNAGKSTLLNALLREDRAIVSSIAGTTRDSIEETMTLGGVLFRFIDTAGIRLTSDTLEAIGIERTFTAIKKAQIVMFVVDSTADIHESLYNYDQLITRNFINEPTKELFVVINKCDLSDATKIKELETLISTQTFTHKEVTVKPRFFQIAASQQNSTDTIENYLSKEYNPGINSETIIINNLRHYNLLSEAQKSTKNALEAMSNNLPSDLISTDIRQTLHHLGTITGQISTDDILHNIFHNFCIGK